MEEFKSHNPLVRFSGRFALLVFLVITAIIGLYLRYQFFEVSTSKLPPVTDEALNMLMAKDIAAGNYPLLFWTQPYQFPLEAYILSLFVDYLPADAFGARVVLAVISAFSIVGFSLIFLYSGKIKDYWPGLLLVFIPSTYFLIRQVAFVIPQYSTTITFAWALPLFFVLGRRSSKEHLWAFASGVTAGMALSVHLLSLPIVCMVGAATCWGKSFRSALKNTAFFLPAFTLGMIPYFLAMRLPNAYEKVTDTVGLGEALTRLWDPILLKVMTVTAGINPCIFPDMDFRDGPFAAVVKPFVYIFISGLLILTVARGIRFLRLAWSRVWPALELEDIMVGALWLSLFAAALAGFGVKYRYLLPVAWYLPFLFSALYLLSKRFSARVLIGGLVLSLAWINFYNVREIMPFWQRPGFTYGIPGMPRLAHLFKYLEQNQITHCYAPWWLAYRISYESGGKVLCSQPYNERFPGWPLAPILAEVEASPDSVYIVQKDAKGIFAPEKIAELLSEQEIEADSVSVDRFVVIRNFRHREGSDLIRVNPSTLRISSSAGELDPAVLIDGRLDTLWSSDLTETQPWIQINLNPPATVHFLRITTDAKHYRQDTHLLKIEALENGEWREIVGGSHGLMHRIRLGTKSKFPGHKFSELGFGFSPVHTSALRVTVLRGGKSKSWGLRQVEVYGK